MLVNKQNLDRKYEKRTKNRKSGGGRAFNAGALFNADMLLNIDNGFYAKSAGTILCKILNNFRASIRHQ